MFKEIQKINQRPKPFEFYTTEQLWNDPYISKKMLKFHLDENAEPASRKKEFIDSSVKWIIDYFGIGQGTSVIDFGCGPGLYTTPLAQYGASVTGVDFSENSIDYARRTAKEKQRNIDYVRENYISFSASKKFDLAIMIYCDFCVLSSDQRKRFLENVYNSLEDGGQLFFDVWSMRFFDSAKEKMSYEYSQKDGFWSFEPYYAFMNTFKYEEQKLYLDKYTIIEQSRTRKIFNWLQCYTQESIKSVLQDSGFDLVETFSNVAGQPYNSDSNELAIVAKKF